MRIYIIYFIDKNHNKHPIAITVNKTQASLYVRDNNEDARCHCYFVESRLIGNGITDITSSEG